MEKTYLDLRKINVNDRIEKKGNLSYLSWACAVDELLQADPSATWVFPDPKNFGQTVMVFCEVTALGKTMRMHLPVMDNRNNAIANPDARKISDSMMRCLAKCIACFGIGLYIYQGEDVPSDSEPVPQASIESRIATYIVPFGKKFKGMKLQDIPIKDIESFIEYLEREGKGKPMSDQAREFIELGTAFVNGFGDNSESEFEKFGKAKV